MRALLPMLSICSGLFGCAGVIQPSPLRPASHPLLEQLAPRSALLSPVDSPREGASATSRASSAPSTARPTPVAAQARTEAKRAAPRPTETERSAARRTAPKADTDAQAGPDPKTIKRRLRTIDGQRTIEDRRITGLDLVRHVFPERFGDAQRIRTLRSEGVRVSGPPRTGDLLFFSGAGGSPEVAIVWGVNRSGVIDARAVARGAVRSIKIDPGNPHLRRHNGRIVNTFLRRIRRGDGPTERYLAGQLLTDVRRLSD